MNTHLAINPAKLDPERTSRATHPGDILYWVACLGGVGLLLLVATT